MCLKQFPFRRLRWHYRSEHESLIQFSNVKFYDGDLIVFPSPRGDSREFGVRSNFVSNPSYATGGRNRSEAVHVVEAIADHFDRWPKKSLGVAAFNKRQADEIELLLDQARREDTSLDRAISNAAEHEPLFIKNLENVQGDERDVIFISTTYGPEKAGAKVHQRFGPLASDLGWRRLNVVITRARQRVEVFTSMRPTDVLVGEGARRGVRALRDYLEFAETGKIRTVDQEIGGSCENDFEEAVGSIVEQLGYEVVPQVGVEGFFIDLGVRHPDLPGEYLMGIECDGATYHSALSVRDRDRLRQEILEAKGWHIYRVWSTSWFHMRVLEIDRLESAIGKRLKAARAEAVRRDSARPQTQSNASRDASDRQKVASEVAETEVNGPRSERLLAAVATRSAPTTPGDPREAIREALDRFWLKNIEPVNSDREASILSDRMIDHLVEELPEAHREWRLAIPLPLRERMDRAQMQFLDGILDVICEFA